MIVSEAAAPAPTIGATRPTAMSLAVRATSGEAPLLVAQAAERIGEVVDVVDLHRVAGGGETRLHLTGGARVRIAATTPAAPHAHLPDTLLLSTIVDHAGDLDRSHVDAIIAAAQRIAFTGVEMNDVREQMPLTTGIPALQPDSCLAGVAPVLAVHHMTDFLVMVESIMAMGVPPDMITVIDKGYRYRHTHRVDAHLRAHGITVYPWTETAAALTHHVVRARKASRSGLLIDDGGYTLPVLLDHLPHLTGDFVGLVEQTMSGITKLEPFEGRIPLPIFSVAQSRLKATIESYGVADAAVRNLLSLLPHEKFEGQPALVVGFGRIGEQIAEILRTRRMRVAVYDTAMVRLVAAHGRGFTTDRSLERLLHQLAPLLIVGSTGRTSLRGEHVAHLRRDCYLVSVTSRNREFGLDELNRKACAVDEAGQLGIRLRLPHGCTMTVVAGGYPINFHYAESLPNKYADLVLAALLIGAATLARPGRGLQPGHNVAATDRVLEASCLLERYYQMFGPEGGK